MQRSTSHMGSRSPYVTQRSSMSFSTHICIVVLLPTLALLLCAVEICEGRSQVSMNRFPTNSEFTIRNEIPAEGKQQLGISDALHFARTNSKDASLSDGVVARAHTNRSAGTHRTSSHAEKECDSSYGVLPCSRKIVGNLFLLTIYGYVLFRAARMLSDGSELLLTVLDPGLIGGLLLPVLGALPDALLILVSGLGGTKAEAQKQVLVGIGLLAGSVVMLLTLLWGTCLIIGRCDLEESTSGKLVAKDKTLTRGFSLTGTGVTVDDLTKASSLIMMVTVIPYIVAQLPKIFQFSAKRNIPVLTACILSLALLVAYCSYQVFSPWIQKRKILYAKKRFHKYLVMQRMQKASSALGNLIDDTGGVNKEVVTKLFDAFDKDHDDHLSQDEIQYLLNVSMLREGRNSSEDALEHLMADFDLSQDRKISRHEFEQGMEKWFGEHPRTDSVEEAAKQAENEYAKFMETEDEDEDEDEENPPTKQQIIRKSVLLLLFGAILAAVFADPLVNAVDDFSEVSKIPTFFVSFVLLPIASNSSEGVSSIVFSSRKKKKNMSLTYSQIYGGVTMNNTLGLGIFLAVVYVRGLVWDFSAEVLIIVLVTLVSGVMASFRNTFPMWVAGIALSMYPLSLGIVAILDYVAGWE